MHDTATLKAPDQLSRAQSVRGTSSIGSNAVCKHTLVFRYLFVALPANGIITDFTVYFPLAFFNFPGIGVWVLTADKEKCC